MLGSSGFVAPFIFDAKNQPTELYATMAAVTQEQQLWNDWKDLESEMSNLLSVQDNNNRDIIDTTNYSIGVILGEILSSSEPQRLRKLSHSITTKLTNAIHVEKTALDAESSEVSERIANVSHLENEITNLRRANDTIINKKDELINVVIPAQTALASMVITEIDNVENRHIKMNNKIKHELSLHALVTNIKWDYGLSKKEVLVGEVSIPNKCVHRRFVIDRGEDVSEYDIAEQLWTTIGG